VFIIVGVLLLPALLVATWIAMWFSRRWLVYFPAALAAVLLLAAVVFLAPRPACSSSAPAMCLDDLSLFGTGNVLTGFWTWLTLLVLTGLIELTRHVAHIARLRRTADE
jgi:hypothetical protein